MSNAEQIKTDDAIFNAALSVLGEWPATRECSMRTRMTMAADMQDRIMDTVHAMLTDKKRSVSGKAAADRRWAKQKAKAAATTPADVSGVTPEMIGTPNSTPTATEVAIKKRGRPRKVDAVPVPVPAAVVAEPVAMPPPVAMPQAELPPPLTVAVPPLPPMPPMPPMPSAAPPAPTNPFGVVAGQS